jgi:hypothetical protein
MSTHLQRHFAAALSLAALLVPAAGTASAVAAAPHSSAHVHQLSMERHRGPKNCGEGNLCAYTGKDFSGRVTWIKGDNNNLENRRDLSDVKSLYNNTNRTVTVWERKDFKGRSIELAPGRGEQNITRAFGNRVASDRWEHGR